jgi:hypothetical protein
VVLAKLLAEQLVHIIQAGSPNTGWEGGDGGCTGGDKTTRTYVVREETPCWHSEITTLFRK